MRSNVKLPQASLDSVGEIMDVCACVCGMCECVGLCADELLVTKDSEVEKPSKQVYYNEW
jgi:hypothetical protein